MAYISKKKIEEARQQKFFEDYFRKCKEAGMPRQQVENFINAGLVLSPKQMQFAGAARSCDEQGGPTEILYGGARGGGKTWMSFAQLGADDCQRAPGLKVLILRKVGKANVESIEDVRRKVYSKLPHDFAQQRGVISFPNGSRIIAGHYKNLSDIDAYLGLEYDVIAIEEATTLTVEKYKNIKTCLRTSRPDWRPRMYLTTNPGNVGHGWVKARFVIPWQNKSESDTRFIPATVKDNKHVNEEYEQTLKTLSGWQREAWLNGNWNIAAGMFFVNWRENIHIKDQIDESNARKWLVSFDYGWAHYTVFHLAFSDNGGRIFVVDEHAKRQTTIQEHSAAYFRMLARHRVHPSQVNNVCAGPDIFSRESDGSTIAKQYLDYNIRMVCGKVDRVNGWSELAKRLGNPEEGVSPTMYFHRRCTMAIEQIPLMIHDMSHMEDCEKVDCDDEGNGGDDAADSIRLMCSTNPDTGILTWAEAIPVTSYQMIGA